MSHTTKGDVAIFLHNGDYSGPVTVIMPAEQAMQSMTHGPDQPAMAKMDVPFEDLEHLVFSAWRDRLLDKIDSLDLTERGDRDKVLAMLRRLDWMEGRDA